MVITVILSYLLPAQAQSSLVVWSAPVRLPEEAAENTDYPRYPSVAVDPWGGIHVFWVQGAKGSSVGSMIFYTYGDGQFWLEPIDLFADLRWGAYYNFPAASCDEAGTIHLIWVGGDGLYYSSAPALDADKVRSWGSAQVLVRADKIGPTRLVVDRKGVLHVVYSRMSPGANVIYLRSEDRGLSWSDPVQISEILPNDPQSPIMGQVALDSHDGLHVVWTETYPPAWVGRHVFYARSNDGGTTWTLPVDLSDLSSDEDWDTNINLAVDSQDQLHIVWVCGSGPGRCYRYSTDGGDSWSNIQPLFEGLVGYGGQDVMVSDPYGSVYWASLLRYPQAFYFSSLADGRWIDPPQELLDQPAWGALAAAHWPQLVIGQGNQLHLVMTGGDHGALWYMRGDNGRPSLQSPPTPSPEASSTPEPTPAQPAFMPQPSPLVNELVQLPSVSEDSYSPDPVLFGLAPALLLVLTIIVVSRICSGHG